MVRVAVWLAVVGLSVSAVQAQAQSFADAIAQCRLISNQQARHNCYDNVETGPTNVRRDVGKFNYQSSFDPITGQALHQLNIRSDRGLNPRGNPIVLEWSCDSTRPGDYRLELIWQSFLDGANPEVLIRIGEANSVIGRWQAGRLRETSIFEGSETGLSKDDFISILSEQLDRGNTSLVFRTQPYNRQPITAVFDFSGFDEIVEPMRESCQF